MKGLLLVNLGSPDEPTPTAVARYLRQFLMDPMVIDIPKPARWLLVEFILLLGRAKRSAEAYRKVWRIGLEGEGSPLKFHTRNLGQQMSDLLYPSFHVEAAFRYANPSIESALRRMKDAKLSEIIVIPLYPQYALSSSQTVIDEVKLRAQEIDLKNPLVFVEPFYNDEGFIQAFYENISELMRKETFDYVLFSYHGLPERHVKKLDASKAHCLVKPNCCESMCPENRLCYRAQCYETTRELTRKLRLNLSQYGVSFQSRLGRTPWIPPYSDEVVCSPSFVADCLETLAEIQIRYQELFISKGGTKLTLVPSLNSSPAWTRALSSIIKKEVLKLEYASR